MGKRTGGPHPRQVLLPEITSYIKVSSIQHNQTGAGHTDMSHSQVSGGDSAWSPDGTCRKGHCFREELMVRVSVGYNFILCGPHWKQDQVGLHWGDRHTLENSRLNLSFLPTYTCRVLASQQRGWEIRASPFLSCTFGPEPRVFLVRYQAHAGACFLSLTDKPCKTHTCHEKPRRCFMMWQFPGHNPGPEDESSSRPAFGVPRGFSHS